MDLEPNVSVVLQQPQQVPATKEEYVRVDCYEDPNFTIFMYTVRLVFMR